MERVAAGHASVGRPVLAGHRLPAASRRPSPTWPTRTMSSTSATSPGRHASSRRTRSRSSIPSRRIDIGLERIHDGIVYGDRVLFTTVDGKVVFADTRSLAGDRGHRPARHARQGPAAGLVRGLLLDGDRLWVGFSRMRPTRFRENVAFLKNGFRHYLGTHVACYDLSDTHAASPRSTPRPRASTRCSGCTPPTDPVPVATERRGRPVGYPTPPCATLVPRHGTDRVHLARSGFRRGLVEPRPVRVQGGMTARTRITTLPQPWNGTR